MGASYPAASGAAASPTLAGSRSMPRRRGRARHLAAVLVAGLAVVAVVGPVSAAAPQSVRITSHMTFPGDGPNYGDFSVDGGGGLMCASGRVEDTAYVFGGGQSNRKLQILVLKDFICADGSGTIHVKIQVHVDFAVGETYTWIVQGGTGPYATLYGSGQGTTIPNDDPSTGNTNIYDGFLVD
jgi:hypothetical protein